ncbi:hypothetical protein ANCDUO_18087, partial [Ancylostoma duodenale]
MSRPKRSPHFTRYTGHRRKFLIKIIILCWDVGEHCSDFDTMNASEETCITADNEQTCTFNHATIMTLQPLNQETCLLLKDNDGASLGLITIRVKNIHFEFAGSCKKDTCDNTKTTDRLKEFSKAANNHPGFTFCAASCGCLTCGRIINYTVFNCPAWELAVEAHIVIQKENNSEATTVQLHPGRTLPWNDIRFSLIGATVPQLPILSSAFITDGVTTGITKQAQSGHLVANTIGQLQCYSQHEAKKFNCTFPSNVCTCSTAVNQARCSCSSGKIRETLKKAPLIYQNGQSIEAKSNIGSILQLHVVAEELKLISTRQNATCTVIVSDVVGCYHCLNGARIELARQSSEHEVTAGIQCGKHQQIATCTKSGHVNKLTFNFGTAIVEENCTFVCPGGLTKFVISGKLEYVNDGLHLGEDSAQSYIFDPQFDFSMDD